MTEPDPKDRSRPASADEEAILRAKYLDYCSAQVADLLLYLSPDETYLLAEKAAKASGVSSAGSYMQMVKTATTWLSTRVTLPTFEVWVEDYLANPEHYESYFLGFWEAERGGNPDD